MPRAMSGPPAPPSLGQSQAHPDCNLSDMNTYLIYVLQCHLACSAAEMKVYEHIGPCCVSPFRCNL